MNNTVDAFRQYFSSLVNQQIAQSSFNSNLNKGKGNEIENLSGNVNGRPANQNSGLDGLLSLLQDNLENNSEDKILSVINKLLSSGASSNSIADLLTALVANEEDLVYTRTESSDMYLSLENKMKYITGDLEDFINQAERVSNSGQDINKYVNTVSGILKKGDYDDVRRFISVADETMSNGGDLNELMRFTDKLSQKYSDNIEALLFGVQTLYSYGADLNTSLKILENMKLQNEKGRKNVTEITQFLNVLNKSGYSTLNLIYGMAESGNSIMFLERYADKLGFRKIDQNLDYDRFKRIEQMDTDKTLVMKQGESVALYAVAISTTQGVLPPDVLFWSSVQDGALANGTSYLDLSKMPPGEYDMYVKIGNYPSTDTANRKVRILDANAEYQEEPEEEIVEDFDETKTDFAKIESLLAQTSELEFALQEVYAQFENEMYMSMATSDGDSEEVSVVDEMKKITYMNGEVKPSNEVDSKILAQKEFEVFQFKKYLEKLAVEEFYRTKENKQQDLLTEEIIKNNQQKTDYWSQVVKENAFVI